MESQERQGGSLDEPEGQPNPAKGPSDPSPESVPSEEDAEQDLPGVPEEAED
jgi:hypothetical protein